MAAAPSDGRFDLGEIDLLTTSVGRGLIRETYRTALANLDFDGPIHVGVVIDPAYGVDEAEIEDTTAWLRSLPERDARVADVTVRRFRFNVGLQRSVVTLLTLARARWCLWLEDDWRCLGPVRPAPLVRAMRALDAGMIALTSPTAAAHGTFDRTGEAVPVAAEGIDLIRLQDPSWAADYLPLHPHLHDAWRWPNAYVQALMEDDRPTRCPDERVRDAVRRHRLHGDCPVYWTRDILFEDIGREWLAGRAMAKEIGPQARRRPLPPPPGPALRFDRSEGYYARAKSVIPGETQTFMKRRLNFPEGAFPVFIDDGDGPFVWDVDGNGYIDMIAGLGALSLGHNHPAVTAAIDGQVPKGLIHSLPTIPELEAAEAVSALNPATPLVRFFKNGGDAAATAIRLARAATGREAFARCGYHGSHDLFMVGTPGVPTILEGLHRRIDPFARSGPEAPESVLDDLGGRIAAVIVALPYHRPMEADRLREIEAMARSAGALFVLDEIVTGLRFPGGSATAHFGLTPDAICWGKSLGGGVPVAALTLAPWLGDAMAALHSSATFGGDALSLAVCRSVVGYCRSSRHAERIWDAGGTFAAAVNAAAREAGLGDVVLGYPSIPYFRMAENRIEHLARMRRLQAEGVRQGVLLREDVNFVTDGFTAEVTETAARRVAAALRAVASGG